MEAIKRAIEVAGTQTALAEKIGATQGQVWQWSAGRKPIPAHRCIPIEEATEGRVTRYDLRPDVFGKKPESEAA